MPPPSWSSSPRTAASRSISAAMNGAADPVAGGAEVDHVQPLGALGRESLGDGERVVAEVGDPVVASLVEAHDRPVEQVDGRHQHGFTF